MVLDLEQISHEVSLAEFAYDISSLMICALCKLSHSTIADRLKKGSRQAVVNSFVQCRAISES